MIPFWWLLLALTVGALFGAFAMALATSAAVARRERERQEELHG
ncbi:MAG TPA: hypothetical protein VNM48_02545 [Chloroflexota bacterium]|nr:hypothetical protein [Chloroflexota bacterium]